MSSSICPHFTQNAWKKDLCSNCFKSKDEHKQAAAAYAAGKSFSFSSNKKHSTASLVSRSETDHKKTDYPNKYKTPAKSIIKKKSATAKSNKSKSHKVTFPKNLYEVIGYGGEWSDNDDSDDDDHDFMNLANENEENAATSTDDEETLDLKRITRANTDFNMNNGNLLGDPEENIKKSFAALKLGAPQVDKEGKKQTLKISVVPFGATSPTSSSGSSNDSMKSKVNSSAATKASYETKTETISKLECSSITTTTKVTNTSIAATKSQTTAVRLKKPTPYIAPTSTTATTRATSMQTMASTIAVKIEAANDGDGKNSPPIERAMEKSLLDEISETLQQNETKKLTAEKEAIAANATKIKFEITSLAETLENKPFLDLKKPIARNPPITKDHAKPKINVFHKFSDTDSNCSDTDNGISAYYDVVETQVSYENLPDGKCATKETQSPVTQDQTDNSSSIFTSSQYITDMLLSSKTRAASYNLHEGNFMTSKITSDGLIVTKCSSDDALDSTGSSFDGSSDEETSYNMTRSESDSGIGISIGNDYKNLNLNLNIEKERERQRVEKKLSASTNNSDYEDIQVAEHATVSAKVEAATALIPPNLHKPTFSLDKSRELHGEPDGSADPDGSLESKEPPAVQPPQLPALPKSPPPTKTIDARPSFLHGLQKQHPPILLKKPDLPAKPIVSPVNSPLKTFTAKRQPTNVEQQVISQLQLVMSRSNDNLTAVDATKEDAKLKKGRAPNPPPEQKSSAPPTPERDYNIVLEFAELEKKKQESAAKDAAATLKTEQQQALNRTQATVDLNKVSEVEAKMSNTVNAEVEKIAEQNVSPSANTTVPPPATITNTPTNIYTRKLAAAAANASNGTKNTASPVIREKDKRERATINPKFRSLNTFVSQRNNAAKNLQSLTPEPTPRNNSKSSNLSMSEECLVPTTETTAAFVSASNMDLSAMTASDKKSQNTPAKTKTKFSIKKFLRMGASKTTDNLHKKEGIYSEICTGEEMGVVGKPRLVIIHPIDINPTAVEVVKDITKTNDAVATQTVAVVTTKPPAPPLRVLDGQRAHEINKPARPPPPKSAELRRKQKVGSSANETQTLGAAIEAASSGGSMKCKADNVYANLGEIRSSIAPRKPERTASMREREAQLELARKRHAGHNNENVDTISICSSNGENVLAEQPQQQQQQNSNKNSNTISTLSPQLSSSGRNVATDTKPPTGSSRTSTFERKKSDPKIASKLEIFENRAATPTSTITAITMNNNNSGTNSDSRPSSLKDSVRKINSTIDSYLKDKRDFENMYEFVKTAASPPPPPARSVDLTTAQRCVPPRRGVLYSDTASVASYTRSEYGPVRSYGLNNSLANIPRVISASYCGSEVGEFDIYSPYSYYGSEAGGEVATDINDSVWGIPSAIKNRSKATNRLRMRKGRSVVHKTIEDNYTAVVVANHEALAQVLDQLQQTPIVPPALRPLANAMNLRFEDFTILDGAQAFVVGKKAFHAALWTNAPVTLALSADSNQLAGVGAELSQLSGGVCGVLNPITEFCDLVPSYHLPLMPSTEVVLLQATISVLPRLQLDTLQSIGAILKGKSQVLDKSNFNFRGSIPNLTGLKDGGVGGTSVLRNVVSVQNLSTLNEGECMDKVADSEQPSHGMPAFDDVMTREVAFIMLQLVNGMKNLQVKAIEEMPLSLSNVVLSKDVENKDAQARLCVLQGNNNDEDEPMGTLCKCAHTALSEMLPSTKITPLLADILLQERSESLSKSKSVLEFVLWGPSDVVLTGSCKERELALQRWLDLERATVLHGLVRTRVELTVYDECHLMFLVRSNAKMMNDAAKIVCSYQQQRSEEKE